MYVCLCECVYVCVCLCKCTYIVNECEDVNFSEVLTATAADVAVTVGRRLADIGDELQGIYLHHSQTRHRRLTTHTCCHAGTTTNSRASSSRASSSFRMTRHQLYVLCSTTKPPVNSLFPLKSRSLACKSSHGSENSCVGIEIRKRENFNEQNTLRNYTFLSYRAFSNSPLRQSTAERLQRYHVRIGAERDKRD